MQECTICGEDFIPRPQVRRPKACFKSICQKARQKANEIAWRARINADNTGRYHQIQRASRAKRLREITLQLMECLKIGGRMLNRLFDREGLEAFLVKALGELGIRRCNKFWTA